MSYTFTPMEGTTLGYGVSSLVGNLMGVTAPGLEFEKVPTWGLQSTFKTSRPGKIPDASEAEFVVQWDGNTAATTNHTALYALIGGADQNWTVTYAGDGNTTHAKHTFSGWLSKISNEETTEEGNLQATFTIVVTSAPDFVAGTP